jgi:hypothetical protein
MEPATPPAVRAVLVALVAKKVQLKKKKLSSPVFRFCHPQGFLTSRPRRHPLQAPHAQDASAHERLVFIRPLSAQSHLPPGGVCRISVFDLLLSGPKTWKRERSLLLGIRECYRAVFRSEAPPERRTPITTRTRLFPRRPPREQGLRAEETSA